ncbi:uncharacterized protein LOC102722972 isoform X1 [Oryza brachyantha]|uniref:ENT domain-containing protein n=1 Tax=Oryza brachyantha TaxID=4533 RepID=J3MJ07_ORYBR|nr:uncharacterized protein LOC102722972 isoform X1 [Oryza brachyantha]
MMKLKGTRLQPFGYNNLNFAAEGRSAVKKDDARSHPPVGMRKRRWVLGDITEVLDRNSWRLGKIAKVLKNDYFVIRVTGCIQMREFHISCLRFPHAYHGKVRDQGEKQTQHVDHTRHHSRMVTEQDHHSNEGNDHITKRHKTINLCHSSSARNVTKKQELKRISPEYSITGVSKKRRSVAHEVCQQTKKPQPLKLSAKNDIYRNHLRRPFSDRYNDLTKNNITKRKPDSIVLPSSQAPLQVTEENECSVASCSVNFSEHSINTDTQPVGFADCFPDDAMSACPSMPRQESDSVYSCDFRTDFHRLELQAYQSTVRALYASGPLTWEQESLLTNLRLSLNITNEEHLLQLRHLLSS